MSPEDRFRVERLTKYLEAALRRLEKVDPEWLGYGPVYPTRGEELRVLHEAGGEARMARRFLEQQPAE